MSHHNPPKFKFLTPEGVCAITEKWAKEPSSTTGLPTHHLMTFVSPDIATFHKIHGAPMEGSFKQCTVWNAMREVYIDKHRTGYNYEEFMQKITPHCVDEIDETAFNGMKQVCLAFRDMQVLWRDVENSSSGSPPHKKQRK